MAKKKPRGKTPNRGAVFTDGEHKFSTSHEELQQIIEELRSRNAVLRASNEKLQSTNEELRSANDELRRINERMSKTEKDLKRAQAESEERQKRFKSIADNAAVIIWVADKKGNRTWVSWRYTTVTGQEREAALGMDWLETIHPGDRDEVERDYRASVKKRTYFEMTYRLRTDDGRYRWVTNQGTPNFIDYEYVGYVGSITDIDAQKTIEKRKDEFIAVASHELKTPTTTLFSYLQLLENDKELTEEQKIFVESALDATHHLMQLIEDMVSVTRLSLGKLSLHKKKCSVSDFLERTCFELQKRYPDRTITLEDRTEDLSIKIDQYRIKQVLTNLRSSTRGVRSRSKRH